MAKKQIKTAKCSKFPGTLYFKLYKYFEKKWAKKVDESFKKQRESMISRNKQEEIDKNANK